jgi:cysteine desulfurase
LKRIYLDNHSTTQVDPHVLEEMLPWFTEKFGNSASNTHSFGWEAEEACDIAREQIANTLNVNTSEIIFTSGATESINIALRGVIYNSKIDTPHIITLKSEHKSVLDTCKALEKNGVNVSYLNVKDDGIVDTNEINKAITPNTVLISILHANNEIGVIQPIEEIGRICKKDGIIFHVDGAQVLGKIPIDLNKLNIDLFSMSAHKLYGPKGIGALYIRRKNPRITLNPILTGGGQEKNIRPGTLPVPLIVGFGEAIKIANKNSMIENTKIKKLRNQLLAGLLLNIPNLIVNGGMKNRLVGNLNISIPNINGEALIMRISEVSVSTGSACTSSIIAPSHVLKAIGLSDDLAYSTIRFGIGRFNTESDIIKAIRVVSKTVKRLTLINKKINKKENNHELIN